MVSWNVLIIKQNEQKNIDESSLHSTITQDIYFIYITQVLWNVEIRDLLHNINLKVAEFMIKLGFLSLGISLKVTFLAIH